MAKTKQDYYNAGHKDYCDGLDSVGRIPNAGWQRQAYHDGYIDASMESLAEGLITKGGMREVSAQRKRELRKRGIVCQYLYTTVNGKARYGWTKNA